MSLRRLAVLAALALPAAARAADVTPEGRKEAFYAAAASGAAGLEKALGAFDAVVQPLPAQRERIRTTIVDYRERFAAAAKVKTPLSRSGVAAREVRLMNRVLNRQQRERYAMQFVPELARTVEDPAFPGPQRGEQLERSVDVSLQGYDLQLRLSPAQKKKVRELLKLRVTSVIELEDWQQGRNGRRRALALEISEKIAGVLSSGQRQRYENMFAGGSR